MIIIPGISQEKLKDICVKYNGIAWTQKKEDRKDRKK